MFVARAISRSKWDPDEPEDWMSHGYVLADAVTADLRTKDNALSFWQCGSAKQKDIDNAALVIAAGRQHIEAMDIVWLDYHELESVGLVIKGTDGCTPVKDLITSHVDVLQLDYARLGKVAEHIVAAIAADKCERRKPREVRDILLQAIKGDRINIEDLNESLQKKLTGHLSQS